MKLIPILFIATLLLFSCDPSCEKILSKYKNGNPDRVIFFYNCKDTAKYVEKTYFESGGQETERIVDPSMAYTEHKEWFENGQIAATWRRLDGKEHGHIQCWYENGKMKKDLFMNAGIENGEYKEWYENGQLSLAGNVYFDKKDGLWSYYYTNGQLETVENYEMGVLSGKTTLYFRNGQAKLDVNYRDGKKEGQFQSWDSLGQLMEHHILKDDTVRSTIFERK